jgi:hypothetical protein
LNLKPNALNVCSTIELQFDLARYDFRLPAVFCALLKRHFVGAALARPVISTRNYRVKWGCPIPTLPGVTACPSLVGTGKPSLMLPLLKFPQIGGRVTLQYTLVHPAQRLSTTNTIAFRLSFLLVIFHSGRVATIGSTSLRLLSSYIFMPMGAGLVPILAYVCLVCLFQNQLRVHWRKINSE